MWILMQDHIFLGPFKSEKYDNSGLGHSASMIGLQGERSIWL